MPQVNGQFVSPGIFTSVQSNVLPTSGQGVRVPALIGTGRNTVLVSNEQVTRGATPPPSSDALAHTAVSIDGNIVDQNFVTYVNGVDFALNTGKVGWLSNAAQLTGTTHDVYASLSGLNFQLAIASGAIQTIPFTTETTVAQVATTLNAYFGAHSIAAVAAHPGVVAAVASGTITFGSPTNGDEVIVTGPAGGPFTFTKASSAGVDQFATIGDLTSLINSVSGLHATNNGTTISLTVTTLGVGPNSWAITGTGSYSALSISFSGGADSLQVSTTATSNSSLYIAAGTANTILGFTAGSYVQTPDAPAAGVLYYVTYEYAKVTANYVPQFYFTLAAVENDYGPVSTSTTISLGASLAFQNGAAEVCICQENPADGSPVAQVQSALNKLLATQNISIVVSLEGDANAQLLPAIKQHVDTASSTINKLERTAIVGFDETTASYSDQNMINYAASVDDNRVVLLNSSTVVNTLFVGTNTTASVVGSQFVAAALAGVRCNPAYTVAQPMTREVISGFESITNTLNQAEKSLLINEGVCVIDTLQSVPKVLFGTTTNPSTIAAQLFQVTQIMDYCAQTLRGLLDPIFIGQQLLSQTPSQIQTVVSAILTTIQASNIIVAFTTPTAVIDAQIPTQVDVTVGVQPTLEVDVIYITLGLNLI